MKRNKFSLSHYKLLTCDMGELVPCSVMEVLPGDTVQQATSLLVRTSPLLAPVMHPVHVRVHCWFVPHRLVWDGWEDFITGGPDGLDAAVVPQVTLPAVVSGSLPDYLGVPVGYAGTVNAMPFRGYNLIWNEWYRDQDLQADLVVNTDDGPDDGAAIYSLQNVAWEKDYFTSARPWEQKGPAVTIPIGTTAPVTRDANAAGWLAFTGGTNTPNTGSPVSTAAGDLQSAGNAISLDPNSGLSADLTNASAITVNALREALAIQRYEEARARYGSRYVEYLRYLGVRSSDARLQRPEYLGGGRNTIQFSEVLQSAPGAEPDSHVGDLKGHGIGAVRSNRYRRFFEEHGYVFCFVSVLPKTMYMSALWRHWVRKNKDDYWQKEFEHIGQQPVYNKEVYANHSVPDGTFGYQDRYDEYRRAESSVAGDFRTTLNFWHFARDFTSDPALNASFVKAVPTERVFAVNSADVLWIMAKHSVQARRMLSKSGTSFIR